MDNDGLLDLYVNGTVSATESFRDYLFRQTGGAFVDVTPPHMLSLASSHGAQWADVNGDGAPELALAGSRAEATHTLFRPVLSAELTRRALRLRVVDARGHSARAGAEVRLYAAGTTRLLGTRIVDSGSGYDAQSDMPVHFGLPSMAAVDVEITVPGGSRRLKTWVRGVDPARYAGKVLTVPTQGPAQR